MKKIISVVVILLVLTAPLVASNKVGTTAAQFLKIGVGSRAAGMGCAFVAVADDITSLYWNPAGLGRLDRHEAILLHTEWLADMSFDYAGLAVKMGNFGTLGVSITSLSMGEMMVRSELEPDGTGEYFGASDIAGSLAYSRPLTDRFSVGVNFKYIRQNIWHMSANGFAVDIGTIFTTQFKGMKIGMSISNFGTTMRMSGRDARAYIDINPEAKGSNDQIPAYRQMDAWSLPITFRVGLAMDAYSSENHRLTVALDALHPNDNSESVNFGCEYAFYNWAFIRVGWQSLFLNDDERGGIFGSQGSNEAIPSNIGLGLNYALTPGLKIKVDYAFADFGRLENTQRFSIGIEF